MAKPAVFAELNFEAALARSRERPGVMIVDAMAAWCGPCREMDRTTWVDPTVVARLSGPAFAIQIDVDKEQAVAARLGISAMPTLIAFVAGVEHDRLVGGRGPEELIAWIEMVERGERYADVERAARVAQEQRRRRAPELLAAKDYDAALATYLELWHESDPRFGPEFPIRLEMIELVAAHPPARIAFVELRNQDAPGGRPTAWGFLRWSTLNHIVGESDETIRWYEANIDELPPSREFATVIWATIFPLLIERSRWADAGIALTDPITGFLPYKLLPAEDRQRWAGMFVRALYAAGREERANDLEYTIESVDASPEMAAVLATAKQLGRGDRSASR